jgi:hypothetical protein
MATLRHGDLTISGKSKAGHPYDKREAGVIVFTSRIHVVETPALRRGRTISKGVVADAKLPLEKYPVARPRIT